MGFIKGETSRYKKLIKRLTMFIAILLSVETVSILLKIDCIVKAEDLRKTSSVDVNKVLASKEEPETVRNVIQTNNHL